MGRLKQENKGPLAIWRENHGLKQIPMAALLKINPITLSRWEREPESAPPYLDILLDGLELRLAKKKTNREAKKVEAKGAK